MSITIIRRPSIPILHLDDVDDWETFADAEVVHPTYQDKGKQKEQPLINTSAESQQEPTNFDNPIREPGTSGSPPSSDSEG